MPNQDQIVDRTGVGGTSVQIGNKGQWLGEYGWQSAYSGLADSGWLPAPPQRTVRSMMLPRT